MLSSYYALFMVFVVSWLVGYTVFLPGNWDTPTFIFGYLVLILPPFLFLSWKLIKRTKWVRSAEIDFFEKERMSVDEYEAELEEKEGIEKPAKGFGRLWALLLG
jgi:yeast amino acid transporter